MQAVRKSELRVIDQSYDHTKGLHGIRLIGGGTEENPLRVAPSKLVRTETEVLVPAMGLTEKGLQIIPGKDDWYVGGTIIWENGKQKLDDKGKLVWVLGNDGQPDGWPVKCQLYKKNWIRYELNDEYVKPVYAKDQQSGEILKDKQGNDIISSLEHFDFTAKGEKYQHKTLIKDGNPNHPGNGFTAETYRQMQQLKDTADLKKAVADKNEQIDKLTAAVEKLLAQNNTNEKNENTGKPGIIDRLLGN